VIESHSSQGVVREKAKTLADDDADEPCNKENMNVNSYSTAILLLLRPPEHPPLFKDQGDHRLHLCSRLQCQIDHIGMR
jgi:hypothetical protein